jgi:hypothetical protein
MRKALAIVLAALVMPGTATGQAATKTVICKKNATGAIVLRTRKCGRGESKITNISSLRGSDGAAGSNGAAGADGSLRIFGDGSAGALNVSGSVAWTGTESLEQYTSCAVAAGATLTIPSGAILRCSEGFTNEGTIVVEDGYFGAQIGGIAASGGIYPAFQSASVGGLGWGRLAAGNGGYGTNAAAVDGGTAGFSLPLRFAATILRPGPIGGGAGGAAVGSFGGAGGGTLTILAAQALTNNGTIRANGDSVGAGLGGGGAGGILILASRASVTIGATGSVEANGGSGGASNTFRGSGGGGGGGLIHIIAPAITINGTSSVTGGAAGDSSTTVTQSPRGGGGGGGSMAGAGGAGGDVASNGSVSGATAGSDGLVIQTSADPTSLL